MRAAWRTMSSIEPLGCGAWFTCAGAGDAKLLAIGFASTSSTVSLSAFLCAVVADETTVLVLTVQRLLCR